MALSSCERRSHLLPGLDDRERRPLLPMTPRSARMASTFQLLRSAGGIGNIAHVDDDVGGGDLFQRCAERGDELGRQFRDETHRVGQDRLVRRPAAGWRALVGSSVAKSRSSAMTSAPVRQLNRRRFPALV